MQLVDEHDDVRVVGQLLHDRLEALFELTAVFRAGDDQGDVEGEDSLVGQEVRHVAEHDLLRQAFHDGRLADARLADEDGIVLRPAAEDLLHTFELVLAADERVELVFHRRLGQIPAEFGQQRRFLDTRQRRLLIEERHDVLAHGIEAHPLFEQDGRGHRALFAQDPEQKMFRADVVVQQAVSLFGGKLQHTFGFGAERELDRGRDLFAENSPAFDFLPDVFEREMGAGKNPAGQPLALANQAKEEVLGLN